MGYQARAEELNNFLDSKQRPNLTSYIRNVWLAQSKRWVTAFCCIKLMGKLRPQLRLTNETIEFSLDKSSTVTRKYHSLVCIIKNMIQIVENSQAQQVETNTESNANVNEFKHIVDQFNQLATVMNNIPYENILNQSTKL